MELIEKIWTLCEPVIQDLGLELVEVERATAPGGMVVRLYIDRQGGISVSDCANVSREVAYLLDAEDTIHGRYFLEVSSPGIDRVLRKREHFERFRGKPLRLVTREPLEGRRRIHGTIRDCDNEAVEIEIEGGATVRVPFPLIEKANLRGEIPFGTTKQHRKKRGK